MQICEHWQHACGGEVCGLWKTFEEDIPTLSRTLRRLGFPDFLTLPRHTPTIPLSLPFYWAQEPLTLDFSISFYLGFLSKPQRDFHFNWHRSAITASRQIFLLPLGLDLTLPRSFNEVYHWQWTVFFNVNILFQLLEIHLRLFWETKGKYKPIGKSSWM